MKDDMIKLGAPLGVVAPTLGTRVLFNLDLYTLNSIWNMSEQYQRISEPLESIFVLYTTGHQMAMKKKNLSFIACAFYLPSLKHFWDGKAMNTTLDLKTHTPLSPSACNKFCCEQSYRGQLSKNFHQLCRPIMQLCCPGMNHRSPNLNTNDPQSLKW